MKFKTKKKYGEYKRLICPFCSRNATQKNEQGLDVCHLHVKQMMEDIKCTCGKWLELRVSKHGPYFNCLDCGNINFQKGMEIKSLTHVGLPPEIMEDKEKKKVEIKKKEITITSDDAFYFD